MRRAANRRNAAIGETVPGAAGYTRRRSGCGAREETMRGLMAERQLLISTLIRHAARYHGDVEVVSRLVDRSLHRYTYAEAECRSRRLARALLRLGIGPGDRVGTLAWNNFRHFELYYGVSGIGAVCHTINPRLFDEQIVYIVNHAQDRLLFVESSFVPLVERLRPRLPSDVGIVLLEPAETSLPVLATHDELVASENEDEFEWPEFDEWTASALCYTSGTTGRPKGALYSHRSTLLHAYGASLPDAIPVSARDAICPVVPMFHACGWGVPYFAPMNGAKLVLPGPHLDGASLYELFEAEGVTLEPRRADRVARLRGASERDRRALFDLPPHPVGRRGGAAVDDHVVRAARHRGDPGLGHDRDEPGRHGRDAEGQARRARSRRPLAVRAKQGRPLFGVEMKIVDDEGRELPHDGKSVGELLVRGPWIVGAYYEDAEATAAAVEKDGWFHTGDVATIDPDGYLQLTDRRKDIIKSGGEWISSIDLENAAMAHGDVGEAAAIAVPHPRWGERPLLIVTPRAGLPKGRKPERDTLLALACRALPALDAARRCARRRRTAAHRYGKNHEDAAARIVWAAASITPALGCWCGRVRALGLADPRQPKPGRDADAGHGRDHRDPEARGDLDDVLFPDDADHRGGGGGRHAAGDLSPGAGRRAHGRRLRPRDQRQAGRRVRDAVRSRRRKRVCRHRLGLFQLDPDPLDPARPSARDRDDVAAVQLDQDL